MPEATFDWDAAVYQDTGCVVAPKCLTCPLAQCVEDDPNPWLAIKRWRYAERDKRILELYRAGKKPDVIASLMGVSQRSVYRIVANAS